MLFFRIGVHKLDSLLLDRSQSTKDSLLLKKVTLFATLNDMLLGDASLNSVKTVWALLSHTFFFPFENFLVLTINLLKELSTFLAFFEVSIVK